MDVDDQGGGGGGRRQQVRSGYYDEEHHEQRHRGGGCAVFVLPLLNLIVFFLNFIPSDIGTVSRLNDTVLTPPPFAFLMWLVVYLGEFLFVCYQFGSKRVRESPLIQHRLSWLWIFHQLLVSVWLIVIENDQVYIATLVAVAMFATTLAMFYTITYTFRCLSEDYRTADFILVEVPAALLLGWETVGAVIALNMIPVKMFRDGMMDFSASTSFQIASIICGLVILAVAAVLYAGLPTMINPFLHLPILWGLATIIWRWNQGERFLESENDAGAWATEAILDGMKWAVFGVGCIVGLFFLVATCIMAFTGFFIVDEEDAADVSGRPRTALPDSSLPQSNRSPRTAQSALSANGPDQV